MLAQIGFIDHGDGANIRTLPAEMSGSKCLTRAPLPPGTRVAVIGTHPQAKQWSHVAARSGDGILQGFMQGFRITTQMPEPTATLYHVRPGDRLEPIAARIYHQAIEPGRDLRFYENVVLYLNQQAGRAGVRRVTRAANFWDFVFGAPRTDVELVAGHRIWLVSASFANQLQKVVPSGSITGGAVAWARKAARHLEDILTSVKTSPQYLREVAGEFANAILQHLPEIIGIVALFISAEMLSATLAATPTGVGQLAAALIQLGLAAFGAQGMVEAGIEALRNANAWLTQAWQANGDTQQIALASKSFLRMLVSIAIAALSMAGMKSNLNRGLKIAENIHIQPPSLVMMPVATGNGGAVAVPVFQPGSITSQGVLAMSKLPSPGVAAAFNKASTSTGAQPDPRPKPQGNLEDVELEKLLEQAPNWEQLREFIGRRIPNEGTPEFAAFKKKLEAAGYQLDVMQEANQPFRLRRLSSKAPDEFAPLTVTKEGMIVLQTETTTRISVYSRYRRNYLDWIKKTYNDVARQAAATRISAGDQLHHLIPDGVAQRHPLIQEALKRLEKYTIDRGSNIVDMPIAKNTQNKIMHLGSHPEYSKYVVSTLDHELEILTSRGRIALRTIKPALLEKAILKVETKLRWAIETGSLPEKVLKELLEDGVPVGKKLAMLELRHANESFIA